MDTLYPEIATFDSGMLQADDRHQLYYEQCGNPRGKPVIILHGGPGAGCSDSMRRFHDPEAYRIVLLDQRGSGKSTPHADLVDNTTWDLVADIERLRERLSIEKWQVFGGSWGSTLALAYAQKHPDRVTELVLRGIFMLRRWELEWFYQEGASRIYPDAWDNYLAAIPVDEQQDLISAYHRRLTSSDRSVQLAAAKAWSIWEASTSCLVPDSKIVSDYGTDDFALAFARIESHYFVTAGFFEVDDQLLRDAHKIRHIPGTIVHGRYDVVCPVKNAWDLKKVWPEAELYVCPNSGHAALEPEIAQALVRATDKYRY